METVEIRERLDADQLASLEICKAQRTWKSQMHIKTWSHVVEVNLQNKSACSNQSCRMNIAEGGLFCSKCGANNHTQGGIVENRPLYNVADIKVKEKKTKMRMHEQNLKPVKPMHFAVVLLDNPN